MLTKDKILTHCFKMNYLRSGNCCELLIVFRVDPEIAVQRKTDEDANTVRERSTEIWEQDWQDTGFHIIDASQSKTQVLAELKSLIWPEL